jgi:hypothetical protein
MNQLNHNYACCAILVVVVYALYCAGNVFVNHVFPDGAILATIMGTILLIFGYSTGRIHEVIKATKAATEAKDEEE